MKPKNFPGRKNDRRIKVLSLLEKNLTIPIPIVPDTKEINEKRLVRIKNEIANLKGKIVEPMFARGIRTKKHRG